jgi:phospholipase C
MKRNLFYMLMIAVLLAGCATPSNLALPSDQMTPAPAVTLTPTDSALGLNKIKHIVIIMQENRSFDTYFGTYPGADGLPRKDGKFTVCLPEAKTGKCIYPFHDPADKNYGGPHTEDAAKAAIDGGKMDGFITLSEGAKVGCASTDDPACGEGATDVMGYHDAREIPNYWAYAQNYVLQDHMFQPNSSWSLPQHLFMVSEWSAKCSVTGDPMSCINELQNPSLPPDYYQWKTGEPGPDPNYAWTDLTYLLYKNNVSWKYFVATGNEPDCEKGEAICPPIHQDSNTPGIWNPLPYFDTVKKDGQLDNITDVVDFYKDAKSGDLPAVSWVTPSNENSEHPDGLVSDGQTWVTSLVNAVMQGPDWSSSAIFISWDDWGGFYDHVVPPVVDQNGYGLRVPGLVISPYAIKGSIDRQVLSHDAYVKFIEDVFIQGQRIDPKTDGRPDTRPNVRENAPQLGDLALDFDFNQPPLPPLVLPMHPKPGPASIP